MQEEGSQTALRKFYDLCFDRFFRIAYYYLHREEWAQEVVLDVFQNIWERRDSLLQIDNLEYYFFVSVKHAALNYLAKEQRVKEKRGELTECASRTDCSPEDLFISEELLARYLKALDLLPERCREIFIRIREEKQSYADVARELGISVHTVDAQLQKALTRLRKALLG